MFQFYYDFIYFYYYLLYSNMILYFNAFLVILLLKIFLDEPDMWDTAGEVETSS